jgi:hypothetical protein
MNLKTINRRIGWNPINRFNHATFLCLSQAKTSNIVCHGLFFFSPANLGLEVIVHFVDIMVELLAITD